MAKARIRISSKPGKGGTKIADAKLRVARASGRPKGERLFQTNAQLTLRASTTQNGKSRP